MAPRTILAYLPSVASVEAVLEAALKIGGPSGAHIIALHAFAPYPIPADYPVILPRDVVEELNKPLREAAEAVHAAASERMNATLLTRQWRCLTGGIDQLADLIIAEARSCDLVICQNPAEPGAADALGVLKRIVMESGRPTLLLPRQALPRWGERAIVAWKDSREAARAVFDALDLLRAASEVRVVSFVEDESTRAAAERSAEDLVAMLQRHGIAATADVAAAAAGEADESLIATMFGLSSDLLVMGCYGHSRLRETIFGGASQKAFDEAWVPILMSR